MMMIMRIDNNIVVDNVHLSRMASLEEELVSVVNDRRGVVKVKTTCQTDYAIKEREDAIEDLAKNLLRKDKRDNTNLPTVTQGVTGSFSIHHEYSYHDINIHKMS